MAKRSARPRCASCTKRPVCTAKPPFTAIDALDRDSAGALRNHHVLVAVLCRYLSGVPSAASDALEARWFHVDEVDDASLATSFRVADVARQAVVEHRRWSASASGR